MNLIHKILEQIYVEFKHKRNGGSLANYIPELTRVNPGNLGITVTTIDGFQYTYGDIDTKFTIQSVSKPFIYGMALQEHGVENVMSRISVEPSGDSFNSISLYPDTGRPFNPMINAGAIAATGLLWDVYHEQTFDRILDTFSDYAAELLSLDDSVYNSESETGHRNRAIAYLLRNFGILTSDVNPPLETYFKQCSINVNCPQLSVMGATLANNGVNPFTNKEVLDQEYVPKVLSVMSTCGMYDYSGEWIYNVGLPAKSGVGGGVLAVLPGQLAIAVYSPLLDLKGNSIFGVEICEKIAARFSLHLYKTPRLTSQVIRKHNTLSTLRSKYKRDQIAEQLLMENGKDTHVFELQGDLSFATVEIFMRKVPEECQVLVVSMKKCNKIDNAALSLIIELNTAFQQTGKLLLVTDYRHLEVMASLDRRRLECLRLPTLNEALLECEEDILTRMNYQPANAPVTLDQQQLLLGLTGEEITELQKYIDRKRYHAGEVIIHQGGIANNIFFIENGEVEIKGLNDLQLEFTLAILCAGNSFGEMALLENSDRSASVIAKSEVTCFILPYKVLDAGAELSGIKSKILINIATALSKRLRLANQEIAGFM